MYESLCRSGVFVLGDKETITFTKYAACYEMIDSQEKMYCKIK